MTTFKSPPKNILFMLSGSIACFKACELVSQLAKNNFTVKTVCSRSALNFIGAATLEGLTGEAVYSDAFEQGRMMSHIELARWADLILVCPASANTINSLANGSGNGMLTDIFLSNNFQKPFWVAPAMNVQMLDHPATKESLTKLKNWGAFIFETQEGDLACGEKGYGRLTAPSLIYEKIQMEFSK